MEGDGEVHNLAWLDSKELIVCGLERSAKIPERDGKERVRFCQKSVLQSARRINRRREMFMKGIDYSYYYERKTQREVTANETPVPASEVSG